MRRNCHGTSDVLSSMPAGRNPRHDTRLQEPEDRKGSGHAAQNDIRLEKHAADVRRECQSGAEKRRS